MADKLPEQDADGRDLWTVHVYKDSPEWDRHTKWFMLPAHLLRELYVATYDYYSFRKPSEESSTVKRLRSQHPDCVFIY